MIQESRDEINSLNNYFYSAEKVVFSEKKNCFEIFDICEYVF